MDSYLIQKQKKSDGSPVKRTTARQFGWAGRLNHESIFNTARWKYKEMLLKAGVVLFAGVGLTLLIPRIIFFSSLTAIQKAELENGFQLQTLLGLLVALEQLVFFGLEISILVLYVLAYWTREPSKENASTLMRSLFPFVNAGLPLLIVTFPTRNDLLSLNNGSYYGLVSALLGLMILGSVIHLVALLRLRKSFAVMVEARKLVRHGIYKRIRHPIYLSHILVYFGAVCMRLSIGSSILYIAFVVGLILRIRMEEKLLSQIFTEYADYKQSSGMLFPLLFK